MTSEIAPVPLLWILPLAIYLATFALNFKRKPFCPAFITNNIHILLGLGILLYFIMIRQVVPYIYSLVSLNLFLFLCCMYSQNKIYTSRPQNAQGLSYYYVIISIGGFLGGFITSWIIPFLSFTHIEFFIGLLTMAIAWQCGQAFKKPSRLIYIFISLFLILTFFGSRALVEGGYYGLAGLLVVFTALFYWSRYIQYSLTAALILIVFLTNFIEPLWSKENYLLSHRNYYGITKVFEMGDIRFLVHGTTIHGAQMLDEKQSYIPLMYYNPGSGSGRMMAHNAQLKNIAVIGLGTGALAAYVRPYQTLDYYELDPDVYAITKKNFTYLDMAKGSVNHIFGDARISMEHNDKKYDLIIIDAFSGDSVPVHLVTKEALEVYKDHLQPEGILIFHVTNRYLGLTPPLVKTATELNGLTAYYKDLDMISKVFVSEWVAITWSTKSLVMLGRDYEWTILDETQFADVRPWTDKYSSIIPHLRTSNLFIKPKW